MNETTATPRRTFHMKQPRKDELRRQLKIANENLAGTMAQLDDALSMTTVRKLLVVAVMIGVAVGRFVL